MQNPHEAEAFGTSDASIWSTLEYLKEYLEEQYKEGDEVMQWKIFKIDPESGHSPIVNLSVELYQ